MADINMTQDSSWDAASADQVLGTEQSIEDRRQLQQGFRNLIKQTTTDQTKFLDAKAEALHTVLEESDTLLQKTNQTSEAAIDAALVIRISELAYKRTTHFLADRADDTGVNLEDFVARCRDYMRFGRGIEDDSSADLSREQRRRRKVEAAAHRQGRQQGRGRGQNEQELEQNEGEGDAAQGSDASDDDSDEEGDAAEQGTGGHDDRSLDWTHFGQYACLPRVRRPGLARFLPRAALAGDENTRLVMRKRTAALRLNELQEVRPQVLQPGDLTVSQNSDLTALATDILQQLRRAAEHGQAKVQRAYEQAGNDGQDGEDDDALLRRLMDRYGIRSDGGVDLIRFAVNPHSFSQTVENFFYISFLVRDGRVGLAYDDNGLPSIYPISEEESEAAKDGNGPEEDTRKHQLILSMDMAMWRDVIETFNIKKPMIAHRETAGEKHPDGRAWFS